VYAQTEHPGIYRLQARVKAAGHSERISHFVVQSPREESDLAALSEEQWDKYQRALGFARLDPDNQALGSIVAADRSGHEMWLALLVSAMIVAVAELWLARLWCKEMG
jgi:hypothetical protein